MGVTAAEVWYEGVQDMRYATVITEIDMTYRDELADARGR